MVLFPILLFVSLESEEIGLRDQLTVLTSQHVEWIETFDIMPRSLS
jgi:hypothetical protein